MVIESKQTTVAYRCPHCGAGVMSIVDIFALAADMVKLKCDCGKSEMTIVKGKDGKVRMTVPCIICPKPHQFTLSQNMFFQKDLFVLPCPYSDVNIGVMGEVNRVRAELARTELELLDMLEENGIDSFAALHGEEEALPDPQILDIIMFVINDLDAENKIYCNCEDHSGEYEVEVGDDGISVRCKKCGASAFIPTDSGLGAYDFLHSESLYLK